MIPRLLGTAVLSVLCAGTASSAFAQDPVLLRISHFFPPQATAAADVLTPWCDTIESQSDGMLKCEVYPSLQLGGTPAQMYSQVSDNIVDGAIVVPGYTPGRFPKLDAFGLPFISRSGEATSVAAEKFAEAHAADELDRIHLVGVWTTDPIIIHSREAVESAEDLSGFMMRAGTTESSSFFDALGAGTASLPISQTPEALSKGVIDGTIATWEIAPALKFEEIAPFKISPDPEAGALFTSLLSLMLNKNTYENLPDNLKKIIDDNSGVEFARKAGRAFDDAAKAAQAQATEAGNEFITLSPEETAKWQAAAEPLAAAWVEKMNDAGESGQALLEEIRSEVAAAKPAE